MRRNESQPNTHVEPSSWFVFQLYWWNIAEYREIDFWVLPMTTHVYNKLITSNSKQWQKLRLKVNIKAKKKKKTIIIAKRQHLESPT